MMLQCNCYLKQLSKLSSTLMVQVLWGECIAGAMYVRDFAGEASKAGFADARILNVSPIAVQDAELQALVGNAKFYSITYRLFKLPGLLEPTQEDYGQSATYKVGSSQCCRSGYHIVAVQS